MPGCQSLLLLSLTGAGCGGVLHRGFLFLIQRGNEPALELQYELLGEPAAAKSQETVLKGT